MTGQNPQPAVNARLTANPLRSQPHLTAPGDVGGSAPGQVENLDYAAFAARIIRAHGRRIAAGDVESLPDILTLATELDAATQTAVNGLRAFGYSWADIARRLGTTRQAAQQRWGR